MKRRLDKEQGDVWKVCRSFFSPSLPGGGAVTLLCIFSPVLLLAGGLFNIVLLYLLYMLFFVELSFLLFMLGSQLCVFSLFC